MPKPASLPEWASDGTLIVEPAAGLKATGWSNATRPPAKYMNWYQELVYRWCEYLDGIEGEGLTWTVLQNFAAVTASGLLTASAGVSTTTITASGLITANAGVDVTGDLSVAGESEFDGGGLAGTPSVAPISSSVIHPALWGTSQSVPHAVQLDALGGLMRTGMYFFDEFDGDVAGQPVASGRWDVNTVGAGSSATYLARHRARLTCDAAASDSVELIANNAAVLRTEHPRFRIHAKVDLAVAEDMILEIGFEDYHFRINPSSSSQWFFIVAGDASSPFNLGASADQSILPDEMVMQFFIAGATTIHWMMLDPSIQSGTDMEDYIVASGTLTTAASITSTANQPRVYVESTGAGVDADLDIDAIEVFTQTRLP